MTNSTAHHSARIMREHRPYVVASSAVAPPPNNGCTTARAPVGAPHAHRSIPAPSCHPQPERRTLRTSATSTTAPPLRRARPAGAPSARRSSFRCARPPRNTRQAAAPAPSRITGPSAAPRAGPSSPDVRAPRRSLPPGPRGGSASKSWRTWNRNVDKIVVPTTRTSRSTFVRTRIRAWCHNFNLYY